MARPAVSKLLLASLLLLAGFLRLAPAQTAPQYPTVLDALQGEAGFTTVITAATLANLATNLTNPDLQVRGSGGHLLEDSNCRPRRAPRARAPTSPRARNILMAIAAARGSPSGPSRRAWGSVAFPANGESETTQLRVRRSRPKNCKRQQLGARRWFASHTQPPIHKSLSSPRCASRDAGHGRPRDVDRKAHALRPAPSAPLLWRMRTPHTPACAVRSHSLPLQAIILAPNDEAFANTLANFPGAIQFATGGPAALVLQCECRCLWMLVMPPVPPLRAEQRMTHPASAPPSCLFTAQTTSSPSPLPTLSSTSRTAPR